jgi:hypothetical protein
MEPLEKELMSGYYASLDEQGNLKLSEIDEEITAVTELTLPAHALRALLNLLRRQAVRDRIGYRAWQKQGRAEQGATPLQGKPQLSPRAFTRADVEAFFNKHYGSSGYPKCELRNVHLLPELSPTVWLVSYWAVYSELNTRLYKLIVAQFESITGPYLNLVDEIELPEGLACVPEEDAEIEHRTQH